MDMQKLIDMMNESSRLTRSGYHVTLGGLIDAIEVVPPQTPVVFEDGAGVGQEDSYRGYYSDLAFDDAETPRDASTVLKQLKSAAGSTYEGYKGGDFTMGLDTPLWRASWGSCGQAIVGGDLSNGKFVLRTKVMD